MTVGARRTAFEQRAHHLRPVGEEGHVGKLRGQDHRGPCVPVLREIEQHVVKLDFSKHGNTKSAVILSSELADMPFFADRPQVMRALLKRSPSSANGHGRPAPAQRFV